MFTILEREMPNYIKPDYTKQQVLRTSSLKKTGEPYSVVTLCPADIPQMLALQSEIFSDMTADEQCFLLKKDQKFFEDHFASGNPVLGVVVGGRIVAQSVITNPTAAHPKSGMTDMTLNAAPEKITVLQGVIVHPDYRGNRLMTVMVDEWLALANKEHRTNAVAEVATGNFYSWSVFMKEGLSIHSLGHDDKDGSDLYNMHAKVGPLMKQRLKQAFNKASEVPTVEVASSDIASQKTLVKAGFLGVAFDAANQNILFKAPKAVVKKQHKGHKI